MAKKDARGSEERERSAPRRDPDTAETVDTGLEGVCASEEGAGFIHEEEVEGGDELSIGGGPPSAAGGTRDTPVPTREDLHEHD